MNNIQRVMVYEMYNGICSWVRRVEGRWRCTNTISIPYADMCLPQASFSQPGLLVGPCSTFRNHVYCWLGHQVHAAIMHIAG